jgi:hypothetical protein
VNASSDVVGIIDWQHAAVLPLCLCAGIPDHFHNWGDPFSESLAQAEVNSPENLDRLSQEDQEMTEQTMRRRLVRFGYVTLTKTRLQDHLDALRNENSMLRAKLSSYVGAPWEGGSVTLKYAHIQASKN